MALKETGIRLVADNSNVFLSTLNNATNAVSGFEKGVHSVASAPFNLVNSALGTFGSAIGNISQVISGILGAGLIVNLASQISSMSTQAFQAAGQFQLLQIQMEGLIAIQISDLYDASHATTVSLTQQKELTPKLAKELESLIDKYGDASAKLPVLQSRLDEMYAKNDAARAKGSNVPFNDSEIKLQIYNINETKTALSEYQKGIDNLQGTETVIKTISGATMDMADAQKQASKPAAELLDWISDFAVKAPYTVLQISEMARDFLSLGKNVPDTKKYIKGFTSLAAGMGLSNAQLDRLIQNFVQTSRSMKITERDIREYGNSGLPVNRILDEMARKLGITRIEAIAFAKDGVEGVEAFNEAIVAVASKDFPNSMDRLSSTWAVAMSNIKDVVESVLGKELLGPLAEGMAENTAKIINSVIAMRLQFREVGVEIGKAFESILPFKDNLISAFLELGKTILLVFGISTESFTIKDFIKGVADGIIFVLDVSTRLVNATTATIKWLLVSWKTVSDWFTQEGKPAIDSFINTSWNFLKTSFDNLSVWIITVGLPALKSFSKWFTDEAMPAIKKFLDEGWKILVGIWEDTKTFVTNKLLPAFFSLSKWFTDEGKPSIDKVVKSFSDLKDTFIKSTPDITGAIKLIQTDTENSLGIAVPTIINNLGESYKDLAKIVAKVVDDINKSWEKDHLTVLGAVVIAVRIAVATIIGAVTLLSGGISALLKAIQGDWEGAWQAIGETTNTFFDLVLSIVGVRSGEFYETWMNIFKMIPDAAGVALNGIGWFIYGKIVENIRNMMTMFRWAGFTIGYDLIVGVMEGMDFNAFAIKNKFFSIIWDAVQYVKQLLGIASPSLVARLTIGKPLGEGVALGIMDSMGMVSAAMGNLSAQVSPPASSSQINSSSSTQYNNSSSYNLSVNSSQNSSGVVQDFSLMRAMA